MRVGDLPSGTLTFVFTDAVDSTALWERDAGLMAAATAHVDDLLRRTIEASMGVVIKSTGDGVMAVFEDADEAVSAAIAGQRALASGSAPIELDIRMGLCTGPATCESGDYHGPVVNRAARVAGAAHGGQILVAASTAALVERNRLRDLGEYLLKGVGPFRLWQVLAEGLADDLPLPAAPRVGFDVAPVSSFVGRTGELGRIRELLRTSPLVTITGPGGCGKTRVALAVAEMLATTMKDGVRFADLSAIREPDRVADVVAKAIGLVDAAGRPTADRVADHLARRTLLCVLDNCEHVIEVTASLVDAVLRRGGDGQLLATSREPLEVTGEQVFALPPLDTATEAVELFVRRGQAVRSQFVLDDRNAPVIEAICRRLDGMPLAIELAAAKINHLSPEQILERLDDRLRLLAGGRSAPGRQRTLAGAIDWSHELLSEGERVLLRRLSVFPATFSLEAAEQVSGADDTMSALGNLVTKSLVQPVDDVRRFRYRLLETVRIYAKDRLREAGESEDLDARHGDWVVSAMEALPLASRWFEVHSDAPQLDDVRAALEWSMRQGRGDAAALICSGVAWQAHEQWREGIAWCERVAAGDTPSAPARLQLLTMLALLHSYALSRDSFAWASRAMRLGDEVGGPLRPVTLAALANAGAARGLLASEPEFLEQANVWAEAGMTLGRHQPPEWSAYCGLVCGMTYTSLRRREQATLCLERSVADLDAIEGCDSLRVAARGLLAVHEVLSDNRRRALTLVQNLDPMVTATNPMPSMAGALTHVVPWAANGEMDVAANVLASFSEFAERTGDPFGVESVLLYAGVLCALGDDWEDAARLLAAGHAALARHPAHYELYLTFRERTREALGADRARQLRDEGRRLSRREAMAIALP